MSTARMIDPNAQINIVQSYEDIEAYFRWLSVPKTWMAYDCESTGLDMASGRDKMRLFQLGDEKTAWVFRSDRWLGVLVDTFNRYKGRIVGHHLSFDVHAYEVASGEKFPWSQGYDTKIMSHLLVPNKSSALKTTTSRFLGADARKAQNVLEAAMQKNGWGWGDIPFDFDIYTGYAGLDVILTTLLAQENWPRIDSEFREVYELEMNVSRIANGMERRGVAIDMRYVEEMYEKTTQYCQQLEAYCLSEWGIRPSENEQVARKLRELGVPMEALTEKGNIKTDKPSLQIASHPLADCVLDYRAKNKIGNTYFKNFLEKNVNSRLHPSVNTLAARTGRMSINNPALQTIPRGSVVRDCFLPNSGEEFWSVDYSGVEARVFAHFAREEGLIEVFKQGFDPHRYTAQQVFQVEEPSKSQRQVAKNCTFCLLYGGGPDKMAQTGGISIDEAQAFLDSYKKKFPGVVIFMDNVVAIAEQRFRSEGMGYVKTPVGRLEVGDEGKNYVLVNALIQGTSADVLKKAMVDLDNAGYGENMLLPVHDEVIFSFPKGFEIQEAVNCMEDHTSFLVPLVCEATGPFERWGDKARSGD